MINTPGTGESIFISIVPYVRILPTKKTFRDLSFSANQNLHAPATPFSPFDTSAVFTVSGPLDQGTVHGGPLEGFGGGLGFTFLSSDEGEALGQRHQRAALRTERLANPAWGARWEKAGGGLAWGVLEVPEDAVSGDRCFERQEGGVLWDGWHGST